MEVPIKILRHAENYFRLKSFFKGSSHNLKEQELIDIQFSNIQKFKGQTSGQMASVRPLLRPSTLEIEDTFEDSLNLSTTYPPYTLDWTLNYKCNKIRSCNYQKALFIIQSSQICLTVDKKMLLEIIYYNNNNPITAITKSIMNRFAQ